MYVRKSEYTQTNVLHSIVQVMCMSWCMFVFISCNRAYISYFETKLTILKKQYQKMKIFIHFEYVML